MITCPCPANASLPDVPCVKCPERFGQIQKVAFQRLTADDGKKNKFSSTSGFTEIDDIANWQAKMTAADSTKIIISPYIYSPTQETGAPRTFGGGNDSLGGVEEIIGREPSAFTGSLRNIPQVVDYIYPIPIRAFFVGDKVHGGIDNPDTNAIQWSFLPNYSDDLKIFEITTFNPLTDLCGGASSES